MGEKISEVRVLGVTGEPGNPNNRVNLGYSSSIDQWTAMNSNFITTPQPNRHPPDRIVGVATSDYGPWRITIWERGTDDVYRIRVDIEAKTDWSMEISRDFNGKTEHLEKIPSPL